MDNTDQYSDRLALVTVLGSAGRRAAKVPQVEAATPGWHRQPGRGAYAKPERERRFLLRTDPPPGEVMRRIEDRYIDGTRLRLRRVEVGLDAVYKLTQKVRVRAEDPADVSITNMYLTASEHAVFNALPGRTMSKTRHVYRVAGHDFAVDTFQGRLVGLRLAEVEVEDVVAPLPLASWIGQEVTHDDCYSGGYLAFASDAQVRSLLTR